MIQGRGLLTPLQRNFLAAFAELADQDQFYLTGGTALGEFLLGHRLSFDLDLFTGEPDLILPFSRKVESLNTAREMRVSVVRRFSTFTEFLAETESETLRIDLALDSPFRFRPPEVAEQGFLVNDPIDLVVDKLLAFYGRCEVRDAVDLYFILELYPLDELMVMAAEKDPGFDPYWFAIALQRVEMFPDELERWPVMMLLPLDPVILKHNFQDMAAQIMSRTVVIKATL